MLTQEMLAQSSNGEVLDLTRLAQNIDYELEDLRYLADHIKRNQLSEFAIRLKVYPDNYQGLILLAKALADQPHLHRLQFVVEGLNEPVSPTGLLNPLAYLAHWLQTRQLHHIQQAVNHAVLTMLQYKSQLTDLEVVVDNPGPMHSQSSSLARRIQDMPLQRLRTNLILNDQFHLKRNSPRQLPLQAFEYGHPGASDSVLADLLSCPELRDIQLKDLTISPDGAANLVQAIRNNAQHLKHFSLRATPGLTAIDMANIADALQDCNALESIDFTGNRLSDNALESLANLLSNAQSSLKALHLDHTDLVYSSLERLLDINLNRDCLTALSLGGNLFDGQGYSQLLIQLSVCSNLQTLRLNDVGIVELANTIVPYLCEFLTNPSCPVRHLELSGAFSKKSVQQLEAALRQNTSLESLAFHRFNDPSEGAELVTHLQSHFEDNTRAHQSSPLAAKPIAAIPAEASSPAPKQAQASSPGTNGIFALSPKAVPIVLYSRAQAPSI